MRLASLAVLWLATRAWLVWLLQGPQSWVAGDVAYFAESLGMLPAAGLEGTLVEYPVPAVGVVAVPWLAAQALGDVALYGDLLAGIAVLTDLVFALVLWVASRGRSLAPVTVWVLAVPLLGSTTFARFDLLPGVLFALALLLLARHPAVAAVLASLATGIKLWPALLLPALLGVAATRRRVAAAVAATGAVLAGGSLALGGWDRLLSPLAYQSDRGLQIESVLATPAMVAWWLDRDSWVVGYAASKSFEVDGPVVPLLVSTSTLLTVAYLAGLLVAWGRLTTLARAGVDLSPLTTVWLVLASVLGFVVTGKVFSPQYLLWVLPVAAAGLVVADSRPLRAWTAVLLVATGLTHLVFPVGYEALTVGTGPVGAVVATLAVRNVVVVGLLAVAAGQAWRGLEVGQRGSALARQAPGAANEGERTAR